MVERVRGGIPLYGGESPGGHPLIWCRESALTVHSSTSSPGRFSLLVWEGRENTRREKRPGDEVVYSFVSWNEVKSNNPIIC